MLRPFRSEARGRGASWAERVTIQELGSIGEFVAAIATIATLGYLALQIRQNTRTVRGSTLQLNTDFWGNYWLRIAEPELARAYLAGMSAQADISPLQYAQFFFICRATFLGYENQYRQFRNGVLDSQAYAGYERAIKAQLLAYPGFRSWWQQNREVFGTEFSAYVDSMISETPEADPAELLEEWQRITRSRSSQAS